MGCFLGCFGVTKDHKDRKQRIKRKNRVQNVQQQSTIVAEHAILGTPPTNLVSEVLIISGEAEQLSPSPRKRVTFNCTHEHVSNHESTDSQPHCNKNVKKEEEDLKGTCSSHSMSEGNGSVTSSVGSYPPNHRYHNARDSDDEAEEYGVGELDDLDGFCDEDDYYEDIDGSSNGDKEVWSQSFLTPSMESRSENPSLEVIDEEVESPVIKTQPLDEEVERFRSKSKTRDKSDHVNSVLSPVENTTQWKTAKSKGTCVLKPQKENLFANEAPRISSSSELICKQVASFNSKSNSDQLKNVNQEIAVDASLSNWLVSSEVIPSNFKKACFSDFETVVSEKTMSRGSTSVRSFEDRPILGALTMEELKHMSVSSSPRKSPNRSPDEEMPIIGTVGTYWSHSGSIKHLDSASSYKGIPNTTSKYREDKRVNWHSTPFETRLDRALNRGSAEA